MSPVSPHCHSAALCPHPEMLGCAVENIPRTIYRSKQELVDAGLHSLSSSDAYCKDDPETCVFSVLSGIVGSELLSTHMQLQDTNVKSKM